jgi:hypothetical protein
LFVILGHQVANAKGGGMSLRLGGGTGGGSGAVQISDEDEDHVRTFRNSPVTVWLQLGSMPSSVIMSDFGFFGTRQALTSHASEKYSTEKSHRESLLISGGGLLYSVTILFGQGSETGLHASIGVGRFQGKLTHEGSSPESQSYPSGTGGLASIGWLLGTGSGGARSHAELFIGTEVMYTSLTGGRHTNGLELSDLHIGTAAWQAALSFKI